MSLAYLPTTGSGFVPRPCGFGAHLLGIDPQAARTNAADAIVAARQESDLLRPDLTLLAADGTLLPAALGTAADPDELELPEPEASPALGAVLAAVRALASERPTGVLLTGPGLLAEHVGGDGGAEDEDLVDACALVVCDAAKAVLEAGGDVVLEERRAPSPQVLALSAPLLNLLVHHRRPALLVVRQDGPPVEHPGIGAVAQGDAAPAWGTDWPAGEVHPVFAPRIDAGASPERVQALVRSRAAVRA